MFGVFCFVFPALKVRCLTYGKSVTRADFLLFSGMCLKLEKAKKQSCYFITDEALCISRKRMRFIEALLRNSYLGLLCFLQLLVNCCVLPG